jgi:hypothetical protein
MGTKGNQREPKGTKGKGNQRGTKGEPKGNQRGTFYFSAQKVECPPFLHPYLAEINRLDNQALVRYYDSEWHRWE